MYKRQVYNYTVADTEDGALIKALRDKAAEFKAQQRELITQEPEFMNESKPLLVKAGLGLKYLYTSQTTGETMDFIFTPEEVENL